MENILNNIGKIQNSKQMAYMNDIKNVGMGILFGQVNAAVYIETFEKYIDYIEQPSQYLQTLKAVSKKIDNGECTPDDLLIAMCKHTLQIQYEDETYVYDDKDDEYEEYTIEDDNTTIVLDPEETEVLENVVKKIYGLQ